MSTPQKRSREAKRDEKARDKAYRREQKRGMAPAEPELVTADEIAGGLRSIEEVMAGLLGGAASSGERRAAPIPIKLFVGSLSDDTNNKSLANHFSGRAELVEAVVITDRNTGASRNFGFVTLMDRKDAPAVIEALHYSELDGSRIVVNVATERR